MLMYIAFSSPSPSPSSSSFSSLPGKTVIFAMRFGVQRWVWDNRALRGTLCCILTVILAILYVLLILLMVWDILYFQYCFLSCSAVFYFLD